jgi:hypothetical protein
VKGFEIVSVHCQVRQRVSAKAAEVESTLNDKSHRLEAVIILHGKQAIGE